MIRDWQVLLMFALSGLGLIQPCGADDTIEWKAGVATVVITPSQPMWMAGYASRTKPSDGVLTDLHAKALAIEDSTGSRAVIVTTDLISIPRVLREQVVAAVGQQFKLNGNGLLLNCSHTHCSPVVKDDLELSVMYRLEPEQRTRIETYFVELRNKLVAVIGAAIEDLQPAHLSYSHARCGVSMNRRLPTKEGIQNSPFPDGPVDQDVPVLRVESADKKLKAVAFGYACHNTTTGIQQFNADYAGYAQTEIEKAHPGATALFVMGCGGDQNPYPRGQIEWAQSHGKSLANAVEAALLPQAKPIRGPLKANYKEIDLPFEPVTKEELLERRTSKDVYEQRRSEALLADVEKTGRVRSSYPFPVQVLQFGHDLTLITLGGEVVIDYSLRFKKELADVCPVWVAGYSNDVMAYIPSERVLREGGYEGTGAMRYTSLPSPWKSGLEEQIVKTVHELVGSTRSK